MIDVGVGDDDLIYYQVVMADDGENVLNIVAMDDNPWSVGLPRLRTERRRDAPLSRRRWQFALRDEIIVAAT